MTKNFSGETISESSPRMVQLNKKGKIFQTYNLTSKGFASTKRCIPGVKGHTRQGLSSMGRKMGHYTRALMVILLYTELRTKKNKLILHEKKKQNLNFKYDKIA